MARTLLVCALACFALVLSPLATAQASRTREYPLDIPRQSLTRALSQLNQQTNVYYGYIPASQEEENTQVGPLKGSYTIDEALAELLHATDLTYEWSAAKTVSIVRRPPAPKPPSAPPKKPQGVRRPLKSGPGTETEDGIIARVVTTGRSPFHLLPGPTASGLVVDLEMIGRSGITSVGEIMRLIPQQPFLRPDGFRSNGAQYAELRGLGSDTTLVLLNGRRVFASAASFTANAFDLNQVPLSAVQRVEVQLDSISAKQGADAIGGVVNIVLRDGIEVPSLEVRYGAAAGGAEQSQASFSTGYRSEATTAALILDYREVTSLLGAERSLWRDQDYRRFGSLDRRSPISDPPNVFALPGMPINGAPFAAIPEHPAGPVTQPGELRPFSLNTESLFQYSPIVPEDRRASAVASAQANLTSTVVAAADLLLVDRTVVANTVPAVILGAVVPATNPFNTLGQPVAVTGLLPGADPGSVTIDSQLLRGSGSLRGTLLKWDWDLSVLRSEEDARVRIEGLLDPQDPADQLRLMQVLNESDPGRTLNVLGPGPAGSPQVLARVLGPPDIENLATDATQLRGAVTGKLLELPAGQVDMLVGAEWRKEAVQFDTAANDADREVSGTFAELQLPLLTARMGLSAARHLALTVAGRLDRYADFGQIFSPQYGLVWRPLGEVNLRATYGRSFRAPSLYDLYLPNVSAPLAIIDPRRNGEAYSALQLAGGSRELEATRGESFAAGIDFTPAAVRQLELSATYWHVAMDNRVITLPAAFAIANESLVADRIQRAESSDGLPGRILQIDVTRMNFGRLTTSGIDVGASYAFETEAGRFAADIKATWIDEYETLDLPGQSAVDRVSVANSLGTIAKWRAVTSLDWQRGPLNASAYVRYIPSYDDTREGVRNGRTIPAQTFLDLQLALDFGRLLGNSRLLQGVELSAGALNVFNELPSFAEVNGVQGYDTSQGDLKGRFWYVRLGKSF